MESLNHHLISIRVVLEQLPRLGLSVPESLSRFVQIDSLEQNQALSLHQALEFNRLLLEHYRDPLLGLKVAQAFLPQSYGLFGFGLMCAPSLRSSLAFSVRYQRLTYTLMTLSTHVVGDEVHFRFTPNHQQIDPPLAVFFSDRDVAASMVFFRATPLAAAVPKRVTLVHDGYGQAQAYQGFFGCDVEFSADAGSLIFAADYLDVPAPYRNAQAYAVCERECSRLLADLTGGTDIVRQVERELQSRPGYLQDIDSIARQLNLSSRTLRRRLAERGQSFQTPCSKRCASIRPKTIYDDQRCASPKWRSFWVSASRVISVRRSSAGAVAYLPDSTERSFFSSASRDGENGTKLGHGEICCTKIGLIATRLTCSEAPYRRRYYKLA